MGSPHYAQSLVLALEQFTHLMALTLACSRSQGAAVVINWPDGDVIFKSSRNPETTRPEGPSPLTFSKCYFEEV